MHVFVTRLLVASLFLSIPCSARAQDAATDPAATAPAAMPRAAVIADEEAGVIRFIIDGEEVARINDTGLHVRENVNFGGVAVDYGTNGFEGRLGNGGADAP